MLVQEGPRSASIMIVGEAPGAMEAQTGRPFVGGAGVLLNMWLHKANISREHCFVTNVCHVQPPGNKFEWFLSNTGQPHLMRGIAQLRQDISEVRPNVIIALGNYPMQILTGLKGISKYRGSLLPSKLVPGFKVIPTYHPAYCLRVYDASAIMGLDLQRAADHQSTRKLLYPRRHIYIPGSKVIYRDDNDWTIDSVLRSTYDAELQDLAESEVLSVDIECWQRDDGSWSLACVGFASRADRAVVVDGADIGTIKALCEGPARKVYQNGQFDVTVLRDNHIECKNFWWDTMIAHHVLFAESARGEDEMSKLMGKKRDMSVFKKGLAFQTSIYTEEPFYKDDGKLWKQDHDLVKFFRYNGLDALVTLEIAQAQHVDLVQRGLLDAFMESMRHNEVAIHAMWRGIKVDTTQREALLHTYNTELLQNQAQLDISAGETINVKSSPQVQSLLYNKLGLPKQIKQGRVTADKDAIHKLESKHPHPVLASILSIREHRDIIERYLTTPIDADGRIRCNFDVTGTQSYRLSSRASIHGSGSNLQNQPEEVRRMYVADNGMSFMYPDFSQAEARVVAYLARCDGLIELFNDPNRDVHRENAARIFRKPLESINKNERYLAKRVVHAANYGMEADRLAAVVNQDAATTGVRITVDEARMLLNAYFMLYPEIKEVFWKNVQREIERTRTLTNPFGFQRVFYGRPTDSMLRDAYSWIPQSTIGVLGRMAWANVYDLEHKHPTLELQTLCQVHDSILTQCPTDKLPIAVPLVLDAMRIPINLNGYKFYIPTDMQVGRNWAHATTDNPDGLREWNEKA